MGRWDDGTMRKNPKVPMSHSLIVKKEDVATEIFARNG